MAVRCYHNEYPDRSEVVYVKVIEESEGLGFYCELLEYGGLKGFIELKNLCRGRIRSVRQLIEVGKTMYLKVIARDKKNERVLIILSKKKISHDQKNYAKQRTDVVNSFMKLNNEITHLYKRFFIQDSTLQIENNKEVDKDNNYQYSKEPDELTQEIMKNTIWRVQSESDNLVNLYDEILENPAALVDTDFFENDFKQLYLNNFENRLEKTSAVVKQDFNLLSYDSNGVETIKTILIKIKEFENVEVKIETSPQYSIQCRGPSVEETKKVINNHINTIRQYAKDNNALFGTKGDMKVVAKEHTSISFLTPRDIDKMDTIDKIDTIDTIDKTIDNTIKTLDSIPLQITEKT